MEKSMKHILAGLAILTLAACNGSTKVAEAGDGTSICPPSEVISDVATYRNDQTEAQEDYAAWHAANGKRAGVTTTASGLQYQVIKKGASNGPSPAPTDVVKVNYQGFLLDGKVFDSSYARNEAIEFPLNRVIKGWTEGVGLMKPCDAWTFYIPGEIAYGDRGSPRAGIGPNATLGFHVQLIEVK